MIGSDIENEREATPGNIASAPCQGEGVPDLTWDSRICCHSSVSTSSRRFTDLPSRTLGMGM
jgi:hypothetical protein